MNLCSGTLNVLIHGYKRDENLAITVDGKNVTVTETDAKADIELEHHSAIDMIGGMFSKERMIGFLSLSTPSSCLTDTGNNHDWLFSTEGFPGGHHLNHCGPLNLEVGKKSEF